MRTSRTLPLLVILTLAAASPVSAILIRHDRDDAAAQKLGASFPAVGRVMPDGAGTLIAPQWVLTAGHVARTIRSDPPAFRVGDRDRAIRRVFLPPGWTEGPGDLALIELVDPVADIAPIPLYRGRDEAGRIVTIVGDGDPGDGRSGPRPNDGIRRAATNRVARVDADWIVVTFDPPGSGTDLEGISGPGDSGGPALLKVGDEYRVAGVSVWGSEGDVGADGRPGTYGDLDGYTRVSSFLAWIDETLAGKSQPVARQKQPPPAEGGAGVAASVDRYLARAVPFGFSGAVLVARKGEVILNRGYGLADRARGVANTADTIFNIESITKQFTAAAILVLETMGKLQVSDPIGRHLPEVPADKAGITLHQLLTHSAGVVRSGGNDSEPIGRDEAVRRILAAPLLGRPGEKFRYSNAGYTLLAAVVERAAGEPYEQFLRTHLFLPAGMKDTGYRLPAWEVRTVAHSYVGETDHGTPLAPEFPTWNQIGNGGILSTTADLFRWHQALLGEAILPADAKRKLYTPYLDDYGYGWDVVRREMGLLVQHDGGNDFGASAEFRRYLDADVVTILFCNAALGSGPMFHALREPLERLAFGREAALPPEVAPSDPAALARLAGVYRIAGIGTVTAEFQGGRLLLAGDGPETSALVVAADPAGSERLAAARAPSERLVRAAAKGDYAPLAEAFGGGMPLSEVREREETM